MIEAPQPPKRSEIFISQLRSQAGKLKRQSLEPWQVKGKDSPKLFLLGKSFVLLGILDYISLGQSTDIPVVKESGPALAISGGLAMALAAINTIRYYSTLNTRSGKK